jgi:hypothetical protein
MSALNRRYMAVVLIKRMTINSNHCRGEPVYQRERNRTGKEGRRKEERAKCIEKIGDILVQWIEKTRVEDAVVTRVRSEAGPRWMRAYRGTIAVFKTAEGPLLC